jgi:hypothetical protein
VSDDFDSFKNSGAGGDDPPDGTYMVTLVKAKLGNSRSTGDRLVILEFQSLDLAYYWTVFRGVSGSQGQHTNKMLTALGIDFSTLSTWDDLPDALALIEDTDYKVKVSHNGNYLNTDVIERPASVQTQIPVAAPAKEPAKGGGPASAVFDDDDDIPF